MVLLVEYLGGMYAELSRRVHDTHVVCTYTSACAFDD